MERTHSFGYWLRRRRKALDLTQAELAQRVSCSLDLIQKIEADARRPSKQLAERLADSLGLDAAGRVAFVQAARAERAADRLTLPSQPVEQPAVALPQGTITFLFADIEGSARLWEQHPRAMPAALARHNALLKAVVRAYGGAVFKTVGDSLLAAFAEAPVALAAALAAQRVIGTEAWELPEPPRVRMALHTGSVESRNGEYVGPVLNRAARVLAAGHGGQVLLSLATEQLVREHLPPETTLRDLGTHRLKDLSLPEQIFQVAVPDLPASFPALNTLDARPTNLPAQPTALIGREQEVVAVATLLRRSNVRLVTLTGPGGVGKTRLSLQAAAELVDDFAHGVYFVDLAPIREPSLVTSAIAATLRVRESGGQPLLAALKDYLRDKRLLLLLDNFEHLLDAASLVAELLAAAAQLKVLVTSREVLHLRGEKEVSVQPLALPNPAQLPPLEQLSQYAAVALFVERALDARPDFVLTNAHAPAVAEICARLDGLPLAIELAAVRLKLFTPEALLERLSSRLPVLTGGARDLPMRQQTMRATIAWSYDLLTDAEQALFRRLGVFVGGCTPEAIDAVCSFAGDASLGVQPEVAALVDKSLLRQIAMPEGETRFSPLETIREYAQEQLDASGEAQQMHLRHARYYLALSQQGVSDHIEFVGSWVHRLDREYDNLHAALVWSRRSASDAALALQLSGALIPLWRHRGFYRDAIAALEQALNQPRAGSSSVAIDGLEQIHRYMRRTLANLLAGTGNFSAAHIQFEQLLLRAREQGDTQLAGYMCERLGWLAREQGDSTTAWRWMTESLTIFRELGDARAIAGTLVSMAGIAIVEEDAGQVELLLAESRALAEHAAPDIYAWTLNHLGNAAQLRGDYTRAAQLHRDSLAVFPSDYHAGVRSAYHSLGESVLGLGQLEEAARWLRQGLALSRRLNARDTIAWCLAGLGSVAALDGQPERAARLWGAAEQLRQTIGCRPAPAARATYERAQEVARAQLGETAFAAAWAEGQRMPLEQAIVYALENGEAEAASSSQA